MVPGSCAPSSFTLILSLARASSSFSRLRSSMMRLRSWSSSMRFASSSSLPERMRSCSRRRALSFSSLSRFATIALRCSVVQNQNLEPRSFDCDKGLPRPGVWRRAGTLAEGVGLLAGLLGSELLLGRFLRAGIGGGRHGSETSVCCATGTCERLRHQEKKMSRAGHSGSFKASQHGEFGARLTSSARAAARRCPCPPRAPLAS